MNDCMTFPDTVEEFMEQYKVVDTEHIYTNGSEFVPIFRMKQWFKHLPSAQPAQSEMIKEIRRWINSGNRGNADYFIVDRIEEIINAYEIN